MSDKYLSEYDNLPAIIPDGAVLIAGIAWLGVGGELVSEDCIRRNGHYLEVVTFNGSCNNWCVPGGGKYYAPETSFAKKYLTEREWLQYAAEAVQYIRSHCHSRDLYDY